jgi:hypothetical protein
MPSFSCRLAVVGDWCDLRKHLTNNELTDIVFAKPGPRAKMEEHILSSVEDQSGIPVLQALQVSITFHTVLFGEY